MTAAPPEPPPARPEGVLTPVRPVLQPRRTLGPRSIEPQGTESVPVEAVFAFAPNEHSNQENTEEDGVWTQEYAIEEALGLAPYLHVACNDSDDGDEQGVTDDEYNKIDPVRVLRNYDAPLTPEVNLDEVRQLLPPPPTSQDLEALAAASEDAYYASLERRN